MGEWKTTIDILSACLVPIVAILGILFTWRQYSLDCKKRKDDLFDRRYAFYQKLRIYWLSTQDEHRPEPDVECLIPLAEEARFIFGEDIQKHVFSFDGKRHGGSPFFPNEDFVKPFRKYLELR